MKQIKKRLALLLSVMMLFSTFATPVTATEQAEDTYSKVVVNPLYQDAISNEELEQELDTADEQSVAVFSWGRSVSPRLDTTEAVGTYVRSQMVNRETRISFTIPNTLMDFVFKGGFFQEAVKYSDSCSGQEGDALAFGISGYGVNASSSNGSINVTVTVSYYTNAEQEQQLTERVNQAMSEMALSGKSEFEKAKTIYEYVCSHVAYDYTYSKYSAYNALVEGESVCQGFATLFYRLCKEAGLSVRIISGWSSQPHAWNIVRIGNVYYNMDTTWDDQSASGNYSWIFKSEKDFQNHIRDDEYATRDFYLQYPMADASLNWNGSVVIYSKLNAENYAYTYETIDGQSVTSAANGKPRLLMYYRSTCPNSLNTMKSLAETPLKGVDIVMLEAEKATKSELNTIREKYGSSAMIYTYDATGETLSNMWTYARAGGYGNTITYPLIVFIDANNKIQYVSSGLSDAAAISDKLEKLCGYAPNKVKSISVNKNTLSFTEGSTETAGLTATVNPSDAINNRIVWSSSNPLVCTVDENGVVTPVGKGNAVITVNVGDESCVKNNLFATCTVTVGAAQSDNGNAGGSNTGTAKPDNGNTGTGNTGNGNTGSGNTGTGDTGNGNTGNGDTGNSGTNEPEVQTPNFGWYVSDGKNYWYEDGVRQGTNDDPQGVLGDGTVRGREIYDPVSDGWYWLDAVYDGAKAINKEVWMPYIYQNEADWGQDEIRMNAEASGDMAEQVVREINNKSGKWVRYDANGKMYKGWYTVEGAQVEIYPEQAGNTYYYDQRTGLMAKGEVEIEGRVYYFDEITGVLQW